MKNIKISPDLIMSVGMSIALVLAIIYGASAEITCSIICGMSGYMGQVITVNKRKPKTDEQKQA